MEQARLFIAIALAFLVFILWDFFFVADPDDLQKQQKNQISEQSQTEKPVMENKEEKPLDFSIPATEESLESVREPKIITVNTPFYSLNISEKGAAFKSFVLKKYRETVDEKSPFKELISKDIDMGTVLLGFAGNSLPGLDNAVFSTDLEADSVDVFKNDKMISFTWVSKQGVVVSKKFFFSSQTYLIGLTVAIKNSSTYALKDDLTLSLTKFLPGQGSTYGFEGPSALIDNKLIQIKTKKIKEQNRYAGKMKWVAIQDRYFLSSIIPVNPGEATMHLSLLDKNIIQAQYVQSETLIRPGTQRIYEYKLYFGPLSTRILKNLGFDLRKVVNFGMFDIIAQPCLWLMNFLYSFIPNYGVAIIILTLLIKLVLWPLGTKSYKSMNEMKKLQPLMTEIREKHKNDKKKMNAEIMGLYKLYKINPVGGCLPMIVQIPVFFALYRMLYKAIELRHAPFLWWINDLSAPDRLLNFNFAVPMMQPPYGIPVLTIIMGGTMFLQQKMQPPQGDPAQAKIMMFLPIVFTVIFINFPSGLVLYWLVNNIISILQQYYVSKKFK